MASAQRALLAFHRSRSAPTSAWKFGLAVSTELTTNETLVGVRGLRLAD